MARYVPPATSAAVPIIEPLNGPKASSSIRIESYSTSDGVSKAKATAPPAAAAGSDKGAPELQRNILSNLEANASSQQQGPERRVVRSVKVIGDTDHTGLTELARACRHQHHVLLRSVTPSSGSVTCAASASAQARTASPSRAWCPKPST